MEIKLLMRKNKIQQKILKLIETFGGIKSLIDYDNFKISKEDEYDRIRNAYSNIKQYDNLNESIEINNLFDLKDLSNSYDFYKAFLKFMHNFVNIYSVNLKADILNNYIKLIDKYLYYYPPKMITIPVLDIPEDNPYGIKKIENDCMLGLWFVTLRPDLCAKITAISNNNNSVFYNRSIDLFLTSDFVTPNLFPNITEIDIDNISTSDNIKHAIIKKISTFPKLTALSLTNIGLKSAHFNNTEVFESLKILNISDNNLGYEELETIFLMFNSYGINLNIIYKNLTESLKIDLENSLRQNNKELEKEPTIQINNEQHVPDIDIRTKQDIEKIKEVNKLNIHLHNNNDFDFDDIFHMLTDGTIISGPKEINFFGFDNLNQEKQNQANKLIRYFDINIIN